MTIAPNHFLYPANVLSLLRLALAVPVAWLVANPGLHLDGVLVALIVIAILTDVFDGYLGRKLGQITDLGRVLDPVADKVIILSGIAAAIVARGFPVLIVALLAYRDVVIVVSAAIIARRGTTVVQANFWGKLNTAVMALLCLVYTVRPASSLARGLSYTAVATILISGLSYYAIGERQLFHGRARWAARLVLLGVPILMWVAGPRALPGLHWL